MTSSARSATDRRRWSKEEALHHINYLELLAAFLALQFFCQTHPRRDHSDKTRQCHSSDIHKQVGGNTLTPTLSACCNHMGLEHTEKHLPTGRTLSREGEPSGRSGITTIKDRCDRMLNPLIFNQIQLQIGPPEIDMLTSQLMKQLPQFYSWKLDPEAQGTDAFNQDWSQMRGFAISHGA